MGPASRTLRLYELVELLGGNLLGSGDVQVREVAPLGSAGPEQIAYLANDAHRHALRTTNAAALIVRDEETAALADRSCIVAPNPYAYFVRVATLLHPQPAIRAGIHALAAVHATARVAASAEVAAFATIGERAQIGERVFVGPGCHVGTGASVGDDTRLHANVTLYDRCIIGKRGVMNAGCVIGGDGFGGALDGERWLKMPHIGRVVIGDDVEVGANTTIDRGAMADTIIEDGVKLDNQIQVGHNVHIGAHSSIAGCVGIAGSTRIGAHCVIGGAAMISGHLQIGERVQISGGTVIAASIDKPGRYTGVYPSSEHRAWLKGAARVRRLGEAAPESKPRETRRSRRDHSK